MTPLLRTLLTTALAAAFAPAQAPLLVRTIDDKAQSTKPLDVLLPELQPTRRYSVLATLPDLASVGERMLRVELFDPTGMPTGKVLHAGDPDMHFVFRPRLTGPSVLRIGRATSRAAIQKTIEDPARAATRDDGLVALQQDGAELADALRDGDGDARLVDGDAYSGKSALQVRKALGRTATNVPGWGFKIAEKPGPGEYRYVRFAWKLEGAATAMLQFANAGELAPPANAKQRYRAGAAIEGWAATEVAKDAPRGWTVVTRDLFADQGAITITGIALMPCGGTLAFDHCYLGRSIADLDKVTPEKVQEALANGRDDGLAALPKKEPPAAVGPFTEFPDALPYRVEIREIPLAPSEGSLLESEPNDQWNYADEFTLGTPVRGGADDIEYLDNQSEGRVGWDWLRFTWNEDTPKLVFFSLDYPDRDVPTTIQIYARNESGALVPYKRGKDTTEVRHDNQDASIAGWKFITRVIGKGQYWLRIKANHPTYTLHTTVHDVPPYSDPRVAVRVAAEYVAKAGDGFFANVPRGGAVRTRAETNTDDTTRCFACHAGHYPVLGNLAAAKNGYQVADRAEFRNLVDRIYNVNAPFYGYDDATWARFDLAPTTGIARNGTLICWFEEIVSKKPTDQIAGAARFAELVYGERDTLPKKGDRTPTGNYEFDGNRPISDARVATEAWRLFAEMGKRTGEAKWKDLATHMETLIGTARLKDNEDLVEQTLGMLEMDRQRFAKEIEKNLADLQKKRHDDGGWVTGEYMTNLQLSDLAQTSKLDQPNAPSLVFFTAQVAHTLWKAGTPIDDPILKRAVAWLLAQQLEFGGWVDPKGELFKTPYLETKWVLIFLANLFPEDMVVKKDVAETVGEGFAERLLWLDSLWHARSPKQVATVCTLLADPNPVIRTSAALALQRMGWNAADAAPLQGMIGPLTTALGDRTKEVARAAALALRTLGNGDVARDALLGALASADLATRRFATRAFVHQFWGMAKDLRFLTAILARVDDKDFVVRMNAVKAAQQWWYRVADPEQKDRIVAKLLHRARVADERPEVVATLEKGLHNLCDENTLELYANDMRVLATDAQREKVRAAREEVVERRLAKLLADELTTGTRSSRLVVLRALGWRILRGTPNGNDIDDVAFFDAAAARMLATEIAKALDSEDAATREAAAWACVVLRKHVDTTLLAALLRAARGSDEKARTGVLRVLDGIEIRPAELDYRQVATLVGEALGASEPDSVRAALRLLRKDTAIAVDPARLGTLVDAGADLEVRKLALQVLGQRAERDAACVAKIWEALFHQDMALRAEAAGLIEKALKTGGPLVEGSRRWDYVSRVLAMENGEHHERALRFALVNQAGAPWREILPAASKLLHSRRPNLRQDTVALLVLAKGSGVDVDASLRLALDVPDTKVRTAAATALGLDPKTLPRLERAKIEKVESPLDFDTFAAFVNPILTRKSPVTNQSCVQCHFPRAKDAGRLPLVASEEGAPTEDELIRNYNAAVALVDMREPDTSLLLRKPLNPDPAIGALHGVSHGGGVTWSGPTDSDFQTVRDWAHGNKLDRAAQFHFEEFRDKVLPVILHKGPTGDACWECHNTHNTLFMPEPSDGDRYTAQEARQLLDFVLRTVDMNNPEESMILLKPMFELDNPFKEKDPNRPTHGGGIRWPEGKRSWQYRAVHDWVEKVTSKR